MLCLPCVSEFCCVCVCVCDWLWVQCARVLSLSLSRSLAVVLAFWLAVTKSMRRAFFQRNLSATALAVCGFGLVGYNDQRRCILLVSSDSAVSGLHTDGTGKNNFAKFSAIFTLNFWRHPHANLFIIFLSVINTHFHQTMTVVQESAERAICWAGLEAVAFGRMGGGGRVALRFNPQGKIDRYAVYARLSVVRWNTRTGRTTLPIDGATFVAYFSCVFVSYEFLWR